MTTIMPIKRTQNERFVLSSQMSSEALSQNSSERVINTAIIHAGCWRRQASHSFHCNQRSRRLVIFTHSPAGRLVRPAWALGGCAAWGFLTTSPPGNSVVTLPDHRPR